MNFLPIVTRELRVVSRKPWIYWVRSIFGLAGIIVALMIFYEGSAWRTARGMEMLWGLSVITMLLALLSGCLLTAECISSEKREDTLGFLFLTNLKGYDVVTGKIAIHAVTTACGLLAVFPVFFLPILAGGVTWAETLRVLLGIGVSFLFALSLGVWISTRSCDARNAVLATLIVMVLVVALPLLWLAVLDEFLRINPWLAGVPQLSPGMLLFYARDAWYFTLGAKAVYWISIGIFLVASVVLARLASGLLPRVWQSEGARSVADPLPGIPRFRFRSGTKIGSVLRRRRFRSISGNPFLDLALSRVREFRWTKRLRRIATGFFAAMLLFSFLGGDEEPFVFAILAIFAMHAGAKFVFAFDATRALNDDKRSSVLELLLATPLGERQIADGHAQAFRMEFKRHIRWLLLLTIALQFTAMVNDSLRLDGDDLFFISSFLWGTMIWTWSDYRTASWLGMSHALKQGTHIKATLRTLVDMVVLPWIPYFVVLFCMAESNVDEEGAALVTWAWAVGGAIYQQVRAARKRVRVIRQFRNIVSGSEAHSASQGDTTGPRFLRLWPFSQRVFRHVSS